MQALFRSMGAVSHSKPTALAWVGVSTCFILQARYHRSSNTECCAHRYLVCVLRVYSHLYHDESGVILSTVYMVGIYEKRNSHSWGRSCEEGGGASQFQE